MWLLHPQVSLHVWPVSSCQRYILWTVIVLCTDIPVNLYLNCRSEEAQKCPCCVEERTESEYSSLKREEVGRDCCVCA